jgi:multiple sugar transport system permease protein
MASIDISGIKHPGTSIERFRKMHRSHKAAKQFWGFFFIMPSFIFFVLFLVYPVLESLVLSFFEETWREGMRWVGLKNYFTIFQDFVFRKALVNTFLYVLYVVPTVMVLALVIAVLVHKKPLRVQSFFRITFYIPTILSAVSVSLVWNMLFNQAYGLLNSMLVSMGMEPVSWLGNADIVMISLSLVLVTMFIGKPVVLLLAGINGIDSTYFEAAAIDGANRWQEFWKITLPLLKPTFLYVFVTTTINAFLIFTVIRLMTGGGPAYASTTVMYLIYTSAFSLGEYTIASTMGVILFIFTATIAAIQFLLLSKSEVQ